MRASASTIVSCGTMYVQISVRTTLIVSTTLVNHAKSTINQLIAIVQTSSVNAIV
jgi:hypothetical protein